MEMKKESKLLRTAKHLTSAREFTVFVLVLLAIVIMTATNPFFLKTANLQSVLLGLAADGILAVAITFACIDDSNASSNERFSIAKDTTTIPLGASVVSSTSCIVC